MKRFLFRLAVLVLMVPLAVAAGFVFFFDADTMRPRAERAASNALGHPVRISGPLTLQPSLRPSLGATGITATGADGAPILTVEAATLRLALLPLMGGHLEVEKLDLAGGVLRLDAPAWVREPTPQPVAPATPPAAREEPMVLDLRSASLTNWRVSHGDETFTLSEATVSGAGPGTPLTLAAQGEWRATPLALEGEIAPPQAWMGTGEAPFRLALTVAGARLGVEGQRAGNMFQGSVTGEVPSLSALSTLVGRPLPALTGVTLRLEGGFENGAPRLANLELRATGGEIMGATITALEARLPALDAALDATARLNWRGTDLTVTLRGPPEALMAGRPADILARVAVGEAALDLTGSWPAALQVAATIPDLAALSPLAGQPLPALRDLTVQAGLAPQGSATAPTGITISALRAASSAGDLAGALEVGWAGRPGITGQVTSQRLDLAALRIPAAAPVAAPAAAPEPSGPRRLIPDITFDLTPLRAFDADLRFTLAQVVQGDFNASAVQGRFVNAAGQARLDPFAATLPGGPMTLRLSADARPDVPSVQVAGAGRDLDLAALLAAFGTETPTGGRADVEMDLRGQGNGLRALAASADGHFGLAVIDARLGGGLAQALQQITPALGQGAPLACLAFRADAEQGLARVTTLFLDGAAGRLAGEGNIRLSDETLAMRLLTDLRVAGIRVRAPVPLTGRLMAPRLETQGVLAGALAGGGMPSLPDCATTLRVARGGRDGPVPAPAATAEPPAEQAPLIEGAPPAVNELLRGFLRR